MKNIAIKTVFILIILIILVGITTKVSAWSPIKNIGDDFIKIGEQAGEPTVDEIRMKDLSSYIYNILLAAGVIVAVVVATVLGIQFMIGGAEGQAKVKEMLVPFVVGCIVVFGGFGFWKIALTVGQKIEDAEPNRYDFSQRQCEACGQNVEPQFDMDKHAYVCPKCGQTM